MLFRSLLIADEALQGLRHNLAPHHTDLAEVWRARTGLPMVFAVWAAREDSALRAPDQVEALAHLLTEAQKRFADDPEVVVRAAAERFPFSADEIRTYFSRLQYGFDTAERTALTRFLADARAAGELTYVPALAA